MLGFGRPRHLDDRRRCARRRRSCWRDRNHGSGRGGWRQRFACGYGGGRRRSRRWCRRSHGRSGGRRRSRRNERFGGTGGRCGDGRGRGGHCGGRTLGRCDRRFGNVDGRGHRRRRWGRLGLGRVSDGTRASLLRGCLLGRLGRLFGLNVSLETFALGLAADAVSLGLFDARRLRLDADAEREAHVECLFVRETELFGELVNPDLACHLLGSTFRLHVTGATGGVQVCHVRAVLAE